jgi:hypothetical protein
MSRKAIYSTKLRQASTPLYQTQEASELRQDSRRLRNWKDEAKAYLTIERAVVTIFLRDLSRSLKTDNLSFAIGKVESSGSSLTTTGQKTARRRASSGVVRTCWLILTVEADGPRRSAS